ncbi:MAG: hypothetical protein GY847_32860 [Proteobacteria bacterium]|nr:hypothetical protein [Pseudomonadota bacterium]
MNENSKVEKACKDAFNFLEIEYGFKRHPTKRESHGIELTYKNNSAGLTIFIDFHEFYPFCTIHRLVDGKIPSSPGEIRPDTLLNSFDLDDIVSLRSKGSLIPSLSLETDYDQTRLIASVLKQAENLRAFAKDVLLSDFSVFLELDKIVKKRAKAAAFEKWGEEARSWGWS